jgi:hypothetical protein
MRQAIVPESWAEAMDAEGFEEFKESGVLFTPNLPPNRTARPSRAVMSAPWPIVALPCRAGCPMPIPAAPNAG